MENFNNRRLLWLPIRWVEGRFLAGWEDDSAENSGTCGDVCGDAGWDEFHCLVEMVEFPARDFGCEDMVEDDVFELIPVELEVGIEDWFEFRPPGTLGIGW